MDTARHIRSRIQVRAEFEDALDELSNDITSAEKMECNHFYLQTAIEEGVGHSSRFIRSGNQMVDCITAVFSDLIIASDNLMQVARKQIFDSISIYGEDPCNLLSRDGGIIEMISGYLPQLHQISQFISASRALCANIVLQIRGFFKLMQAEFANSNEFTLIRIWRALGDLLSTFIVLDEIINSHPILNKHWTVLVRSMRLVQHNPTQFEVIGQCRKIQQLNTIINKLQTNLMSGNILSNCCAFLARLDNIAEDNFFMDKLRKAIDDMLTRWEASFSKSTEDSLPNKQRLLSLLALTTFYHSLLPKKQQPDRKMKTQVRKLCATHKKMVSFHLFGDLLFTPFEFITKQIPGAELAIDRKTISTISQLRKTQLDRQLEQINKDIRAFEQSITDWKEKMATKLDEYCLTPASNATAIQQNQQEQIEIDSIGKSEIILEGAHISDKITRLLKCILNGHLADERPLSRTNASLVIRLVELSKIITTTFNAHWNSVLECTQCACSIYSSSLLCLLETNMQMTKSNNKQPYFSSALKNAEISLGLPVTRQNLIIIGVSLEMANYTKTLRGIMSTLDEKLQRMDLLWNFSSTLAEVSNLSFLYWHRFSLVETYCSNLITESNVHHVKDFFDAINDSIRIFSNAKHCSEEHIIEAFGEDLFNIFKKNFLCKLCTEIENELRISFHALQSSNLEEMDQIFSSSNEKGKQQQAVAENLNDSLINRLPQLLLSPPIKLGNMIVDLKKFVTHYLDSTFYNLSVIALHDCASYQRMRILAQHRFGLKLLDPELPTRSVDQGLDIVILLRNVDKFVDNYAYDLIEQFFIERDSPSKQLGIVRIQQIVNSMKTHGSGIFNSLINSTYKYMRTQFQSLLLLLFDEKIKSELMQEIRFYRDSINQLNQYPMDRAEKLANSLRRYKLHNSNYLESFRINVIRIGNSLGLVRLFSAGIVEIYAPNILLNSQPKEAMVDFLDSGSTKTQIECAKLCDRISQNVSSNLREMNESIELLTSVFSKEFKNNEKFAHLRYFFIIVPALMLSHIEYILKCKTRLIRRTTGTETGNEMQFVEDGFLMGIAYILAILNQQFFFNSLNWFESVFDKYRSDLDKSIKELKTAQKQKDESLARILTIKLGQLKEQSAEWNQMMCTLNLALTYLQANEVGEDEYNEPQMYLDDF